ncbi:MAG: hypothetical protein QM726_14795 [Chitinophagaceae bacterium]
MKFGKKLIRFTWLVLFAFMLAICMVLGVVPVIPRRKEQFSIEIKIEQKEKEKDDEKTIRLGNKDQVKS